MTLFEAPESGIHVRPMWEWRVHLDDGRVIISFAPTEQEAYDEAVAAQNKAKSSV